MTTLTHGAIDVRAAGPHLEGGEDLADHYWRVAWLHVRDLDRVRFSLDRGTSSKGGTLAFSVVLKAAPHPSGKA